jgi:Plasmid encoded RepA protein
MTNGRGRGGLTQLGQIPLLENLAKKYAPPTRAQRQLIEAAAHIHGNPDDAERAFMAQQLIRCTLPHSDPGNIPRWLRRSGNSALVLQPGWDIDKDRSVGYPYGIIPRLLLFWIITEAIRTKSRRLTLGSSLAQFTRAVGLDPSGGGKRSDHKRIQEQMRRLFKCHITFQATAEQPNGSQGEGQRDMPVAPEHQLWWHPHPEQTALWESWIELGEKFFQAILAAPVPLDMRALKELKRSPLALDLYAWVCYRAFAIVQKNQQPQFTAWTVLMRQLGADYNDPKNFKKKAAVTLRKIATLYPGLSIGKAKGGFTIHASRLAVPQKTGAKLPV